MGRGPADALTWLNPLHQDAEGNLFIRRNLWVPDGWTDAVLAGPERPAWDVEPYIINMAAVGRTLERIVLWTPDMEMLMPAAQVGKVVSVQGVATDFGLTLVPQVGEI
ncbi:hypothetical protein [Pseudosulfitobacter pseudonitzschiae]|nr:hypothetical protein [Pseudosulfitobacter pseudonitzschiae]UFF14478.1 hypothetical protein LOE16_07170 [Pseudosulfitobacter pseudonitzschiae]